VTVTADIFLSRLPMAARQASQDTAKVQRFKCLRRILFASRCEEYCVLAKVRDYDSRVLSDYWDAGVRDEE